MKNGNGKYIQVTKRQWKSKFFYLLIGSVLVENINLAVDEIFLFVNLVPRALSSFKMAVGETHGQGC